MDYQVEEYINRFHEKFGQELINLKERNEELEDTVSRLQRTVSGLEMKIDYMNKVQQREPKRIDTEMSRLDQKFTAHMNNIEALCGFGDGGEQELVSFVF